MYGTSSSNAPPSILTAVQYLAGCGEDENDVVSGVIAPENRERQAFRRLLAAVLGMPMDPTAFDLKQPLVEVYNDEDEDDQETEDEWTLYRPDADAEDEGHGSLEYQALPSAPCVLVRFLLLPNTGTVGKRYVRTTMQGI